MSLVMAMLAAQAAAAKGPPEPVPEPFYRDAVACAASAAAEGGAEQSDAAMEEILTWGMAAAEYGKRAGRTPAEIDAGEDVAQAQTFYGQLKAHKPAAFAAHRAYCRALLP
ncbi:MAG: hypothetical protein ACK40O_07890 [Allosphingosinicella sp.]